MSNSADPSNIISKIADQAMQLLYDTKGHPQNVAANSIEKLVPTTELAGEYAGPFNLIKIRPDGKNFHAEGLGMKVLLKQESNKWHSVKIKFAGLQIQANELEDVRVSRIRIDGIDRLVGSDKGSRFLLGDLIEPYSSSDQWNKLIGEYTVEDSTKAQNLGIKEIHFKRANNFYYLEMMDNLNKTRKSAVRPTNDTQLIILGIGRGLGETISFNFDGSKPAFSHSGLNFVKL